MKSYIAYLVIVICLFVMSAGAQLGLEIIASSSAQARTFTVLHNFTGSSDGGYPYGGLVRDPAGTLYGTTYVGGSSDYGAVFKVDSAGTETVLHSFTDFTADGAYPFVSLVRDKAGTLYGTTEGGGTFEHGTVFKVDTAGTETVLYSFAGGTKDGCYPYGGLIEDKSGNLYGTTNSCGSSSGYGIVFKLDTAGKERVLHRFAGGSGDGAYPYYASLVMDKLGNLYGVTLEGGASNAGVVYKLSKKGKLTVLHSFGGSATDGCHAYGTPVMDQMNNLYGTTEACGASGDGIVWRLNAKGTETVLHNFAGGSSDGAFPYAGVILDSNGNLYGVTNGGGSSNVGTVYKLSRKGKLTVLHSFSYSSDGGLPIGGVIRDAKGGLYGTAVEGGSGGYGTAWSLR